MLIHLDKSTLFTEEPAVRFSRQYDVPTELWYELWRRYRLLAYTVPEMCEYFELKTKRPINKKSMYRWVTRGEIYERVLPAIKRGVLVVNTEFFEPFEEEVIKEVTRNMRGGGFKSARSIV